MLRDYRRRAGLSQEDLGDACGMSNRAISDLERGVSRPRGGTLRRLGEVLGLSAEELAGLAEVLGRLGAREDSGFGALLRAYRLASNLSQDELAANALVSARAISDLEREGSRVPRRQTVVLLADALGLEGAVRAEFEAAARTAVAAAGPTPGPPEARQGIGSLPLFPWPLLGRTDELSRLLDLIATPTVHLVTLTGMGGVGKTRLAAEAGAVLAERGARVLFVSLAAVASAGAAAEAITATLEIADTDEASALAAARAAIADQRLTVVLDNIEQIPGMARIVSALAGRGGTVIVTSRVRLRIPGERELNVAPLGAQPAEELFTQRAIVISPDWSPGSDAALLREVCALVDRLPLALELLATWVRVLPLRAIRDRLAAGLDLVGVTGDPPPGWEDRHRSLQVVLDASYRLLGPVTQRVFRRLAVFPAAFEAETAEAVCGDESLDGLDVLSRVAALRDASLLTAERDSDGELRLLYPRTVRDYASAALTASGESVLLRARHAATFARLAQTAAPRLTRSDQGFWLERLDRCADDLRAALAWYLDGGDATAALVMSGHLWRFWYLRGWTREGRAWLRQALAVDHLGEASPSSAASERIGALATARYGAGVLAYLTGEIQEGQRLYLSAREAYLASGDYAGSANALNNLGMIELYRGDRAAAKSMHSEALIDARRSGDVRAEAVTLANLAKIYAEDGQLDLAEPQAREALAIFTELGDGRTVADLKGLLAECALKAGRRSEARVLWQVALASFGELGDRSGSAPVLVELGTLDLLDGDLESAISRLSAASTMADEIAEPWSQAIARVGLARHAHASGDTTQARALLDEADVLARKAQDPAIRATIDSLRDSWSS